MTRIDYFDDPTAPPANSIVPSVTVVVPNQDGAIALIHRTDNDRWALPGDGVDIGESIVQAAVREVREETGLTIEIDRLIGTYTDPRHVIAYDDGEVRQQFALCLSARLIDGEYEKTEPRRARPDGSTRPSLTTSISIRPCGLRIDHYLQNLPAPYLG